MKQLYADNKLKRIFAEITLKVLAVLNLKIYEDI